jgi:cellulose synthase/poly-beta-1,6-N-acetylglucosamine synthase-like glycosyltransferase
MLTIIFIFLLLPYTAIGVVLGVFGRKLQLKKNYDFRATVSIFLPTYNEEAFIKSKLDSLLSQTYPINEILVYDCSNDTTGMILREYEQKYPLIKVVNQETRIGMARTLNLAIKDAKSEIIVKTDCDSLTLSNDALKELIANFADPNVGGATGICLSKRGVEKYFRKVMGIIQIAETNIDSTIIAHASSLMSFRKRVVEYVDANSMADDTEEFVMIRKKGFRTVVDPSVISEEDVPSGFAKRRLQKDRRAQGIIKVLVKNSPIIFDRSFGRFGTVVIPLEFFILIISPFFLIALACASVGALYIVNPLLAAALLILLGASALKKSNIIWAVIDTQLSALIGTFRALSKQDQPLWAKVR